MCAGRAKERRVLSGCVCVGRGLFKSVVCEEDGRWLQLEAFNMSWKSGFSP